VSETHHEIPRCGGRCFAGSAQRRDSRCRAADPAYGRGNGCAGGASARTSDIAGIQTTVFAADPTAPGLYTIRLTVPAHTQIAPHAHRDNPTAVVIQGTWYFGYGPTASDTARTALPPGSFYSEPAGVAHFAETKDEAVVVYITGYGPTDTAYVNPADDQVTPTR
jgi:quercetin dioxygenase-like cupin family protein